MSSASHGTRTSRQRHAGRPSAGPLLREWRDRRRRSQLDLAIDVGVSTRHLSFVETGRSTPSPELVLAIAEHLDVPLRERNTLLLAAGYAPRFDETPIDAPALAQVRASLQRLLDAHDPYPGLVLDRRWDVVMTNRAAATMASLVPEDLVLPTMNLFRATLHPRGLAARTRNFDEWGAYLVTQLRRLVALSADARLVQLLDEVSAYPNVVALTDRSSWRAWEATEVLVPCVLDVGGATLSMFTTLTTFGTPRDITLDELAVELFFPADEDTERLLRASASG